MAIVTALATGAFGAAVCWAALEHSIGWGERGPESGYFPFRIGAIIMVASVATLIQAILAGHEAREPFVDREQAVRVAAFTIPLIAFVAGTTVLGLYVSMIVYLAGVMMLQGGYRWPAAIATAAGAAVIFFVTFEKWLKVPLAKGPIEAWLSIH